MPPALQAKTLRLLQDQEFERVGGNEVVKTDVRLIAATHRDLKAWSAEGKFRPDLYYRLSVVTIPLPPLRARGEDVPLLVDLLLRRYSLEMGREVREVAPEAMECLRSYSWPGNVRELQSVIQQALLKATGTVLLPAYLPDDLLPENRPNGSSEPPTRYSSEGTLADLERDAIQRCLLQTGGNRKRTADRPGISTRTLLRKIREYDLDAPLQPACRLTE
jgi:DNA-binding NtrC family response regulator